jgi:hypothetical protein
MPSELSTPTTRCPRWTRREVSRPVEQVVARVVVASRPLFVCRLRRVTLHEYTGVCRQYGIVEKLANLRQPRCHEVLVVVVVTGPRSQQGKTLDAEQVGEGVLIDHQRDGRRAAGEGHLPSMRELT